jgi:hypothetical protein
MSLLQAGLSKAELAAVTYRARQGAVANLAAAEARLLNLKRGLEAARANESQSHQRDRRLAGQRLVKGEAFSGVRRERRASDLERAREDVVAHEGAIPLAEAALAKAREQVTYLDPTITGAILGVTVAMQRPALEAAREALRSLADPLAHLLAADCLLDEEVGTTFAVPAGAEVPVRGEIVVSTFLAAIPPRLRTPELDLATLKKRGAAIAGTVRAHIAGATK